MAVYHVCSVIWCGVVNPRAVASELFRYSVSTCFKKSLYYKFHGYTSVIHPMYTIRSTGFLKQSTDEVPKWLRIRGVCAFHCMSLAQNGLHVSKKEFYPATCINGGCWFLCMSYKVSFRRFILKHSVMAPWIDAERGCNSTPRRYVHNFNGDNESLINVVDESDVVHFVNLNNRWDFEFTV
jgi:hypothetical protein